MASVSTDSTGNRRILFVADDGSRKAVRVGTMPKKDAWRFADNVQALIDARAANIHNGEAEQWASGLSDELHQKLSAAGLLSPRSHSSASLGSYLIERFKLMSAKPSTMIFYGHTRRNLLEFFGADKPLRSIGLADADAYRTWLETEQGLSPATVNRRIVAARTLMKKAVKWKLISENPFADVKVGSQKNKFRQCFITSEMAGAVLAECPNLQWRLIFALARYGGLRTPSETLALKWADVDFDKGKMRVTCVKTAHHEGMEERFTPIFPELRGLLLEAFEAAEPGTEHVITQYRSAVANLRTQFERIIQRAGLTAWPRLFQNLRATRSTELRRQWPGHIVASWLGHSEEIADKHYGIVTEDDYKIASGQPMRNLAKQAAHFPAQHTPEMAGIGQKWESDANEKRSVFPSVSVPCELVQDTIVGDTGLEPVTSGV